MTPDRKQVVDGKIVEDWCETCGVDKAKHGHPANPCKQFTAHVWDPMTAAQPAQKQGEPK